MFRFLALVLKGRILPAALLAWMMALAVSSAGLLEGPARTFVGPPVSTLIPRVAWETLAYIHKHGEAPPGYVGGRRFGNYGRGGEEKLPVRDPQGRRIEYREWDIHPRTPGRNRGPERIVTGNDGRAWYTGDHYRTFMEMRKR